MPMATLLSVTYCECQGRIAKIQEFELSDPYILSFYLMKLLEF